MGHADVRSRGKHNLHRALDAAPCYEPEKAANDGPGPASYMGDPHGGVLSSRLQPNLDLAVAGIWKGNPADGRSLSLPFNKSISNKNVFLALPLQDS